MSADEALGRFILGYFCISAKRDDFPIKVTEVEGNITGHLSGGAHHNEIQVGLDADGNVTDHFIITTESGLRYKVRVELIQGEAT